LSTASSSCRIDWRPSPLLCLALLALGLLAGASVLMSDLPLIWALPSALLAAGQGARLGWQEWSRAPCALEVDATGRVSLQGRELVSPRLRLRGSLACLEWRDDRGRRGALSWLADTLPVASRRQLLLRLGGQSPA
jgi:toxin CptA